MADFNPLERDIILKHAEVITNALHDSMENQLETIKVFDDEVFYQLDQNGYDHNEEYETIRKLEPIFEAAILTSINNALTPLLESLKAEAVMEIKFFCRGVTFDLCNSYDDARCCISCPEREDCEGNCEIYSTNNDGTMTCPHAVKLGE